MTYASEVAADTPRIWWKLDETSGTTANDSSTGGTLDGTIAGSWTLNETTTPNGDVAARCTGNGSTHSVEVTHSSHDPAAYSVEVWVKPYTLYDYSCYVNDWVSSATGHGNGMMYSTALGGLGGGEDYTGTPAKGIFGTVQGRGVERDILRVGEWTHLVYTNDGSVGRFYRNGVLIQYVLCTIQAATKTSLRWGDCAYAHFAQYDSALSIGRIKAHYDAMVTTPPDAPFVVGTTMYEGGGGAMDIPLPYGAQEDDIVLISAAGSTDSNVIPAYFNLDGLTTGYATDGGSGQISPSTAYGTLNATAISNGYLRARDVSDAALPTSRYYAFAVVVIRPISGGTVLTAATSNGNSATATGRNLFVQTIVGVDSSSSPWSVSRNKTSNDAYEFLGATPQLFKTQAYAWAKVAGNSSFATTRSAGSSGDDKAVFHNWVVEGAAPDPTFPASRLKRPVNAAALSRAVF